MDIEQMRAELERTTKTLARVERDRDRFGRALAEEIGERRALTSCTACGKPTARVESGATSYPLCAVCAIKARDERIAELTRERLQVGLRAGFDVGALEAERDDLHAQVAALRAEVETLRQGWQAERDAATRAHDLLMAERAVRS